MPSPPSGPVSRKQIYFLFVDSANNCPYPGSLVCVCVWGGEWGGSVSCTSHSSLLPSPPALPCPAAPHQPTFSFSICRKPET